MRAPHAARADCLGRKAPNTIGWLSSSLCHNRDSGFEFSGKMRPHRHPCPFAHTEMPIVRIRPYRRKSVGYERVREVADQKAGLAAHSVLRMLAKPVQRTLAKLCMAPSCARNT